MPPELPVVSELAKCGQCGKKILLEQVLIGSNHTIKNIVTCWACLTPEQQERVKVTYRLKDE